MIGYTRAASRLAALVGLTIGLVALYAIVAVAGEYARRRVVRLWHRNAARIVGVQIAAQGYVAAPGTLLVSNHVSYLDVLALGALSEVSFVAKASIATWPVIGTLARLANTLFVERRGRACVGQVEMIANMLDTGRSVVLFAEGTSTAGRTVLPFKSTLFEAAQDLVQPVSIVYAKDITGADLPIEERRIHPWIGEDLLMPHLWALLQHRGVVCEILFHQPVSAAAFESRKELAEHCRDACGRGLMLTRKRRAVFPVYEEGEDWLGTPIFGLLR